MSDPTPSPNPTEYLVDAPVPAAAGGEDDEILDETLPVPEGDEAKAVLEALLFSATSPLSEKRIGALMNGVDPATVRRILDQLRLDYAAAGRGITIMEVAGGVQLATRPDFAEWVFRLHKHRKRSALTPAVLETLAIVAYKQPIVRADIESIRGVDCGGILRQLQDSGLVEIVGRREVPGRPPLYGTSDLFLKSFGLKRLSDLPAIEELHSLLADSAGDDSHRSTPTPQADLFEPPTRPAGSREAKAQDDEDLAEEEDEEDEEDGDEEEEDNDEFDDEEDEEDEGEGEEDDDEEEAEGEFDEDK